MKMIKTLRGLALALLFLLTLHLAARWLGMALYSALQRETLPEGAPELWWTGDFTSYYFSKEKRDSIDTVFIGSSHQFCGVDVNLLNREYGDNAALLASPAQTLDLSYYAALAAIELQHPKRLVLETVSAASPDGAVPRVAELLLDNLPNWSQAKHLAVKGSQEPYRFYYPIVTFHNVWYSIRPGDLLPERLPEGERFRTLYTRIAPLEPWELIPPEQTAPMPKNAALWMDRIVAVCEENDIELILYTAPYVASEEMQAVYNGLNDYAREHGLRYRNMMYDMEAIGLDLQQDFLDEGHVNSSGQEKLTRFLAETLLGEET